MIMQDCIHNLTHSKLQQGDGMRKRGNGAPLSASTDMTTSNWQPLTSPHHRMPIGLNNIYICHGQCVLLIYLLFVCTSGLHRWHVIYFCIRKKQQLLRSRQSVPIAMAGTEKIWEYKKCPYKKVRCEWKDSEVTQWSINVENSVEKKWHIWLCHTTKDIDRVQTVVSCHFYLIEVSSFQEYKIWNCQGIKSETTGSAIATECSVSTSDLTEKS